MLGVKAMQLERQALWRAGQLLVGRCRAVVEVGSRDMIIQAGAAISPDQRVRNEG
jgi:hypothetical protein